MINLAYYNLGFIFFAYLLGSIPFGFIFSRISGRDILKIGWRKTSGSNVFKNVGWWQGALTGICDTGKGFLAVWLAQKLGFSSVVQVLSGIAAVTGHNWSCFLRFAGGRGIGTFLGAFLSLSPQVLGWSLIPFALLGLIWNAAVGTILFLIVAICLSIYFNQFDIAGFFSLLSLVPIFVKRLSPIGEIKKASNRSRLIRRRLLFDNDEGNPGLRIKKLFKKGKWF